MKNKIYPGKVWLDTDGKRIQAHGGSVYYENGIYYWYGENKEFSTGTRKVWTWGIRCYTSKDLYNWKDEGLIIPPDTENKNSSLHPSKPVDRPHILFNKSTQKYVCWLKLSGRLGYFTILTADNILGPYTVVRDRFKPFGFETGDFDFWQNEKNGEAYLYFEHNHAGVIATRLTEDYTDVKLQFNDMFTGIKPPFTREGVTHFMHNGRHYLITSGMTGYVPNPSEVAVSDNPLGPFEVIGNPHKNDNSSASFNSQISCIFQIPRKENFYVAMADRWVPRFVMTKEKYGQITRVVAAQYYKGYKPKIKDYLVTATAPFLGRANTSIADYVWLPMHFENEMPVIEWYDEWKTEE